MTRKGKSLVDSFVFRQAKDAVDRVSKENNKKSSTNISAKEQDHSKIISLLDQDQSNIVADTEQIPITSIPDKNHVEVAPKDHVKLKPKRQQKSITKRSASISLSKSQSDVYLWFSQKGANGEFNKPEIQKSLSMPYITVRKAISKLEDSGILNLNYDGCQKIYEYSLNLKKPVKINKKSSIISSSDHDHNNIGTSSLISSSSSFNKNTTTKISEALKSIPELSYWSEKGLTSKQIDGWMKTAGCSLDSIIQYLCYCRFEMVDLGVESKKPVENVFNWFFKILKRTGSYPKPKGYKSFEQKELDSLRKTIAEKKKILDELKELREREIQIDRDIQFEKMIQNPDKEPYLTLVKKLNKFQRNAKKTSMVFITAMRVAFDDYLDNE